MPIEVVGSGVRTGNLWNKGVPEYVYAKDYKKYNPDNAIALKAGTYTLSSDGKLPIIQAFDANHTQLNAGDTITHTSGYYKMWGGEAIGPQSESLRVITITLLFDCVLTFSVSGDLGTYIMLNLGSTALPYEPYGYKLPLTVNGVEYPIYLGHVQTTRRIKKLMLTGEETYVRETAYDRFFTEFPNAKIKGLRLTQVYCTRFLSVYDGRSLADVPNNSIYSGSVENNKFFIKTTEYTTAADFKSYLAAQYANGTPVTVWYVLAEPETAVVNEPLHKIGDYADTISFAQAGVTIPTVNGANVLDMASTVKPSEMYIKGKGVKPTGYGQLTDVNSVNILDKDGIPIYVHGQ